MTTGPFDLPFDLRSLEIFLAVCDSGRMATAARALAITQPAVSQAIAELERKTGSQLFDRSVRPLALTAAGALLRQRATALIADAREIPALLRHSVQGKVPHLRVGIVDSLSRALSGDIARVLSARAQSVSVLSGLTAAHASALLTRRLDMFIGVDDLQETPGLERIELFREPYVLLLPAKAQPVRTIVDLERLAARLPLVRFSARSQTGLEIERHLRRLGLALPLGFEFDTPYAVAAIVADGEGFAITTPLCVSEAALPERTTKVVRLPGPALSRTLTLVARHRELGSIPRDLAAAAKLRLDPRSERHGIGS
ncbi:MAG: LysR family transcriptional regulator [Hyphomicrobiaceae bacterium]|nr:LysR family transcriptional regulator [Hyphomicrobiaceae bacterium]